MWLVGNGEQSRRPIQLYNPVGSGWSPGPNGATDMAPSTLDPDLRFSQLAALRALTVKVSFLHIEQCPLRYVIWNMSHSAVYDTIIKGPFHPNDLFPVPSLSLHQPRMNLQSTKFHYRVLQPHPFQNSSVRANFQFAKHSLVHRRSLGDASSRSDHNSVRGESIPRASLRSGCLRRVWGMVYACTFGLVG